MPVLDYGHPMAPMATHRAQLAVRAVMAWPDPADEPARSGYIATVMSRHLADLKTTRTTLPNPSAVEGWEETFLAVEQHEAWMAMQSQFGAWFDEAGGHDSVSMAPGLHAFRKDFGGQVGDWFAAGLILALVRRIAAHHADLPGGASVNKAIFILARAKFPLTPRNERDLRKAWAKYRPVAHFCAALFDWFIIAYEHNETPEQVAAALEAQLNENFLMFLAEADAYLEFGLAYRLPRAKAQPTLDPAETWLLPQHRLWPASPNEPAPLSGLLLDAAREYRAPIPGF